jgi:hypothetical protein
MQGPQIIMMWPAHVLLSFLLFDCTAHKRYHAKLNTGCIVHSGVFLQWKIYKRRTRECDIVCCVPRWGAGFRIWSAMCSKCDRSALYRVNEFLFYLICLISRRNPTWKGKKIGEKFKLVGVSGKREKFVCGKRNKKGKESFQNYLQPHK